MIKVGFGLWPVFFGLFWSVFGLVLALLKSETKRPKCQFGRCIQAALALSGVIQDVYTFCDFNSPPQRRLEFLIQIKI